MEELLDNQEEKNWKREEEERERIRAGEICSTENRIWNGRSVAVTGNDEESARMGCISC